MEIIVTIIVILIVRNVYQVIKQNQARQQRGEGVGNPGGGTPAGTGKTSGGKWAPQSEQDYWAEFDWYEDSSPPPQPVPKAITIKPREPKTKEARPPAPVVATVRPQAGVGLTATDLGPPFNGELQPADVVSGIVWAQILGSRGGIQRNKRRL